MTFDVVKLPLMKQDLRSLFAVDLKILAGFYFLEFQCLYKSADDVWYIYLWTADWSLEAVNKTLHL